MSESSYETYLQLHEIEVDEKDNSRKKYSETLVKDLAADMTAKVKKGEKAGNFNPVLVVRNEDGNREPYKLAAGFTRMRAFHLMDAERKKDAPPILVFAKVRPETGIDVKLLNLTENVLREDLSLYELAVRCQELQAEDPSLTTNVIGTAVRKSGKYVANLIRILTNVEPSILKEWEAKNPLCTVDRLAKFAALEHDAQLEKWNELLGIDDEEEEEAEDDGGEEASEPKGKNARRRPSARGLAAALEAVEDCDKPQAWCDGAIAALKFAAGLAKTIPNVYNPKKPPKADDDAA